MPVSFFVVRIPAPCPGFRPIRSDSSAARPGGRSFSRGSARCHSDSPPNGGFFPFPGRRNAREELFRPPFPILAEINRVGGGG